MAGRLAPSDPLRPREGPDDDSRHHHPPVVLDPSADDQWRGVATEDVDEVTTAVGIKLQARSRRLLRSLLAPHKRLMWLAGLIVVFDQGLFLAGPLVVAYGIDTAVPALIAGNGAPLVFTTLAYLIAGAGGALTKAMFVRLSARIAQDVLLDIRGRVFDHSQQLSLSFHEKYTSGRVISRMTSDLDTLSDLAEEGLRASFPACSRWPPSASRCCSWIFRWV